MTISTDTDVNRAQKAPAVTVVIPAYKAAAYIRDALDSVKAQTFTDYEVIVVNDGSPDSADLERVLRSHSLPIVYISQPNRGVAAARNAAIKKGRGEFYAQLDADDQWTPEYLEVQLGILATNPNAALVYPNAMIIGEATEAGLEFMKVCPSEGEVTLTNLIEQKCTVMTCVTARMNVIRNAGMFDENLLSCEDFDLWLRIVNRGGRIVYHRQVLALYRRHEGSLSSDRVWMTSHLLSVFEKAARTLNLSTHEWEILSEQINSNRATLALFEGKRALSVGDTTTALARFKTANQLMHSSKLAVVIFFLQHLPNFVASTFNTRERLLIRQPKTQLRGIDRPHASSAGNISDVDKSEYIS